MHLRHDALAGAAEWIGEVEALAQRTDGLVATVGRLDVEPNAGNVIPGLCESVVRRAPRKRRSAKGIRGGVCCEQAKDIADRRGLALEFEARRWISRPCRWTSGLQRFWPKRLRQLGLPVRRMPSGAGHDAMVMAARVPTAMLFLRSPGGISHHPDETVREEDVEAALRVARKFLERLAAEVR